ncbi:uncharacterized protein [Musca autumnalis]|uniref:uncharacterized protein n=1 Tax=Musca autumnalis TaxID=221902 RepID=UPI003CE73FC4
MSLLKLFIVYTSIFMCNKVKAQYGGSVGGGMGYYPYPYYGAGGMYGGGGCSGYSMPCYYQPYPSYGSGYPCFTSVCCSCGGGVGGGGGIGMGGGYPYYSGGYPYYGNTMRTYVSNVLNYASSSASAIGGYFG